ncbi:MAG: MarR family winged helix-turn-helix transcriptional regulator [Pseudobdellovibrionaceae bacterium]
MRAKKNSRPRATPSELRFHPALENHLGYCLYKAALKFRGMIDEAMAEEGLIAPHFGILLILKNNHNLNQIGLGLQMGIDKATIVKLIDGLERSAYVSRVNSEMDRREKYLQITPRGRKFLEKFTPRMKSLENEFLQPLDADEKRILLNAVPKLMKSKRD